MFSSEDCKIFKNVPILNSYFPTGYPFWSALFRTIIVHLAKSRVYTHFYINGLYINLYINLYIWYINSSLYIIIYILRSNMFFYRTITIYIPFILFKLNGVSSFFTLLEILSFLKIQKKHSIQIKSWIMNPSPYYSWI